MTNLAEVAALMEVSEMETLIRRPVEFKITPESLSTAPTVALARRDQMPQIELEGQLDSLIWRLNEPITGEFVIKRCDVVIRSVELQLVRVETCCMPGRKSSIANGRNQSLLRTEATNEKGQIGLASGNRNATEVQNIQIGDGDLLRNVPIRIHMVLPRLFTCPTLVTDHFRIGECLFLPLILSPMPFI